jgi:hypothetical protein
MQGRTSWLVLAVGATLLQACATGVGTNVAMQSSPRPAPLPLVHPVQDKTFFLFSLMERPQWRDHWAQDATLSAIGSRQRNRLEAAVKECGEKAACYVAAVRWSPADIEAARAAIAAHCRQAGAQCAALAHALRDSGTMIRFHDADDGAMLAAAWAYAMQGVDRLLSVYGDGVAPQYKDIDAMRADPASRGFGRLARTVAVAELESPLQHRLFFADAAGFSLQLLALDGRDEAGRHEPLDQGENRAAVMHSRRVRWADYPYTAIVVPGNGPERAGEALAPEGRMRLVLAVNRYRAGLAPFILVSGGYVHPARTPYSEAIEMKRVLLAEFGVPEQDIIIEPHARHTTTNLRNASRLMVRYGFPLDRPGLVVSDEWQAAYIASEGLDARTLRETGVMPYHDKRVRSALEVEFTPSLQALQVGLDDPLDP